jgi:RNA polymerase sigma-70 factor (ECF subfamily)
MACAVDHTAGEGPGRRGGKVMKGPRNHPSGGNAGPDTPGVTSWTLLDGAGRGDPASRERLVHLYGPLVQRRYLARIRPQDAEDLFQEIFMTVFARLADFERRRAGKAFRPWVHSIARNKIGDYLRDLGRRPVALGDVGGGLLGLSDDDAAAGDAASEMAERALLAHRALELAVAEFEPATREAALRLIRGEPVEVVAAALGKTPNAVRVAKSRALGRVRDILAELGEPTGDAPPPGATAEADHGRPG